MSDTVLSLGGVSFKNMEVPEKINFGGSQRLAIQNVIGGGRVVQALGINDGDISFSGIFYGNDAVSRSQLLDVARSLGTQLPLVWSGFYYLVVIREFIASYYKSNLIPFSIDCTVISDPLSLIGNELSSLANLVSGDLSSAMAFCSQAGVSPSSLSAQSLTALNITQSIISSNLDSTGESLSQQNNSFSNAITPVLGLNALNEIGTSVSRQAGLAGMSGFVNRAVANVNLEFT